MLITTRKKTPSLRGIFKIRLELYCVLFSLDLRRTYYVGSSDNEKRKVTRIETDKG